MTSPGRAGLISAVPMALPYERDAGREAYRPGHRSPGPVP